jgi:hypothetical protein
MNVPVVVSNITCQALDPTGFRYILVTGGLINQTVSSSDGEHQDHGSGKHLDLTHAILAGYQCEDSWYSCGDQTSGCADNDTRCTNTMLSLGFDLDFGRIEPLCQIAIRLRAEDYVLHSMG